MKRVICEITALVKAAVETGIDSKTIITWDVEWLMDNGIKVVPIWKWALDDGAISS